MQSLKNRIKHFGLGISLATTLAVGAVVPAFADDVTGSVDITGGSLTMAATDAPALAATLTGASQTVSDTFDIDVNDATGSGAGWSLSITSTTLSTGSQELSTSAASLSGVSVVCDTGACTDPTNSNAYPLTVPADATAPAAVEFFDADVNTGLGDFTVTPTYEVSLPADAYAGTYNSTITITIATGP